MAANSIFIITRFSVLGVNDWRLSRNASSFEEYKKSLFSDDRLSTRLALFSAITAESLARQSVCDADLYFVVLTSEELPARHRATLDAVVHDIEARSDFTCVVIEVPSGHDHQPYIDAFLDDHFAARPDQRFATVRLDDDDALAASFCKRLNTHLDQGLCGYPISFAYGYEGVVDVDGGFTHVRHWNSPKVAAGLAFANAWTSSTGYADPRRHVYRLGSHTKVDAADALVVDTRAPAYFKTTNPYMDSRGPAHRADLPAVKRHEFAFDEFPWVAKESIDLPASSDTSADVFDPAAATAARAKHRHTVRELKREIKTREDQLKRAQATQGRWSRRVKSIRRRVRRRLRSS